MRALPESSHLPVNNLVATLNKTAATYKFYWLLAIIESVEKDKTMIPKRELFSLMVANAWYTVNYFHVSFGKQDKIERAIENIKRIEQIPIDSSKSEIFDILNKTNNTNTIKELWHFDNQVPHWFLTPWFPKKKEKEIYQLSKNFKNLSPYALNDLFIDVNILWANYFRKNAAVLKDFCYWNLAMYLQAKNPNVPDIPNKLIKPAKRNSLIRQRRQYWDVVLTEKEFLRCIYTGREIVKNDYDIEHFIPYSFVSHDLIWNLIPADKSFNNIKSDRLPSIRKYFNSFYDMHKTAIETIIRIQPNNKILEEYLTILPDFDSLHTDYARLKFKETLEPLITIAANNGFQYMNHG